MADELQGAGGIIGVRSLRWHGAVGVVARHILEPQTGVARDVAVAPQTLRTQLLQHHVGTRGACGDVAVRIVLAVATAVGAETHTRTDTE